MAPPAARASRGQGDLWWGCSGSLLEAAFQMGLDVWCLEQKAQRQVHSVRGETERWGPRGFHRLTPGMLGGFSPRAGIPGRAGRAPRESQPLCPYACECLAGVGGLEPHPFCLSDCFLSPGISLPLLCVSFSLYPCSALTSHSHCLFLCPSPTPFFISVSPLIGPNLEPKPIIHKLIG